MIRFNITDIDIDVKSNGTIIRLKTKKAFSERNISSFINKHGWYYLTIAGAVIDTTNINNGLTRGVVDFNKLRKYSAGRYRSFSLTIVISGI